MRILQVHNRYLQPGGEDSVVQNEAAMLRDAGHAVETFTRSNPTSSRRAATNLALSSWHLGAARDVVRAAREFGADVVHFHNTWFSISPLAISMIHRARFPTVMTLHNYRLVCANAELVRDGEPCELCVGRTSLNAVRYSCYRGSRVASMFAATNVDLHRAVGTWRRHVDSFLALNEFGAEIFDRGGIPREKIHVHSNVVDVDSHERAAAASDSKTFLYVGRLTEVKGIVDLLRSWLDSDLDAAGYTLAIIGAGPESATVQQLADRSASIRYEGARDREYVLGAMARSRALLFPSRWYEGQPLVLLEAMASGLPILASDLGGSRELLESTEAGWTLPLPVGGGWMDFLQQLAPAALENAGRAGQDAFHNLFSARTGSERLIARYSNAIARHGEQCGSAA
jgi:glycosyltransferase involved in cell wall biosynthesis